MNLSDVLVPESIEVGVKASNKKQLLQRCSRRLASLIDREEREIYNLLQEREKLGATAMEGGVAIPHAHIDNLESPMLCFTVLANSVDFGALEECKVDLVAVLLAPCANDTQHLKVLSHISRMLRDENVRRCLRGADSADAVYAILTGWDVSTEVAA